MKDDLMNKLAIETGCSDISSSIFPEGLMKLDDNHLTSIKEVLDSGRLSLFNNNIVEKFEKDFAKKNNVGFCCSSNNCTTALISSLIALDIGQGDEVLLPDFTYAATMMAIISVGATPVPVDINLQDYTIDCDQIEKHITKKTKAIMPVHIFGAMCNMTKIKEIADKYNLRIIEDCAHGLGAKWNGKFAGTTDLGCHSFGYNKTLRAGEGGAVTANDGEIISKIRAITHEGEVWTNKNNLSTILLHDKIAVDDVLSGIDYIYKGSNFRITPLLVAILREQLKTLDAYVKDLSSNALYLKNKLKNIDGIHIQLESPDCERTWLNFVVLLDEKLYSRRDFLIASLHEGIPIGVHFPRPLHTATIYKQVSNDNARCYPKTEYFCNNHLSIPIYSDLTKKHLDIIADKIEFVARAFRERGGQINQLIQKNHKQQSIGNFYAGNYMVL
jgi:perosamine synthetase